MPALFPGHVVAKTPGRISEDFLSSKTTRTTDSPPVCIVQIVLRRAANRGGGRTPCRYLARLKIALREQRGDAVRDRPDVKAHQPDGRTLAFGQRAAERGGSVLQDIEGALGGGNRLAPRAGRHARLEHHRVARRLVAGEGEIGTPKIVEGRERRRHAVVPRHVEPRGEALEAVLGDFGEQRIAIAEMPIGRRGTDAGKPRRLGQAEARRPVLLDQLARRFEQHLFEVAMMIGARPAPAAI